jgi:hypothetical protein
MARSFAMFLAKVAKVYPILFNGCAKETDVSLAHRAKTEFNKRVSSDGCNF